MLERKGCELCRIGSDSERASPNQGLGSFLFAALFVLEVPQTSPGTLEQYGDMEGAAASFRSWSDDIMRCIRKILQAARSRGACLCKHLQNGPFTLSDTRPSC